MSRVNILNKAKALLTKPKEKIPEPPKTATTDSDFTSEIMSSDVHSEEEDELKEYLKSLAAKKSNKPTSANSAKTVTNPKSSYLKVNSDKLNSKEDKLVTNPYLKSSNTNSYPKSSSDPKDETPRNYYLKSSSNVTIKNAQDAKMDAVKSYLKRSNEKLETQSKVEPKNERVPLVRINPVPITSEPAIKINGVSKIEKRVSSDEDSSVGSDFEKFLGNVKAVTIKPQEKVVESDYSDSTSKILRQSSQVIKDSEKLVNEKKNVHTDETSLPKDSSKTRDDFSSVTSEIESSYAKPISIVSSHAPTAKLVTSTQLILDPESLLSSDDSDSIKEIFRRVSVATPPRPSILRVSKLDHTFKNQNQDQDKESSVKLLEVPKASSHHINNWLNETSKTEKEDDKIAEISNQLVSNSSNPDIKSDRLGINHDDPTIIKPTPVLLTNKLPQSPPQEQSNPTYAAPPQEQSNPTYAAPPQEHTNNQHTLHSYPMNPYYFPPYFAPPPSNTGYPVPHPYAMMGYPHNFIPPMQNGSHDCPNCSMKKSKRKRKSEKVKTNDIEKDINVENIKLTGNVERNIRKVLNEDDIPEMIVDDTDSMVKSEPSVRPKSKTPRSPTMSPANNDKVESNQEEEKIENPLYSNHAMLIVDNFIKRHMSVLKEFNDMNKRMIENQPYRRMHYTTLKETKTWIEKNRPKVISLEEALEYVKSEY
ncbi:hypothetical protein HDV06_005122 [Boothiomyces sp. JEL0866]|nr:hypothetical protein HDV06_005122 [Boothiomyces sp. JEL0866]